MITGICKLLQRYFFKNHHIMHDMLKVAQKNAKPQCRVLVLLAPTQWGTLKGCFETVLTSEKLIHVIISALDFISSAPDKQQEMSQEIHGFIADPEFVSNLKKCLQILEPIDRIVT